MTKVSKELVRHYESLGLISSSPVQAGSRVYREFDEQALNRLYLIQKAKNMGLTLKQIKPMLDAFLNYDMSDTEAISILLKQSERMDEIIQQAKDVKNLIQDHIGKIEGKVARHCENHKYLSPRSKEAE
ncbi:MerR family transcriptional regulator [Vibrio fortis]|uniref:helix-turn-helix domain-containing protein n=1 Tax=Vibrio fortis TaxID=212667 RepID=UPI0009FF1155|nr:MerR family transcriptional regulator [Vibrio fortis]